MKRLGLYIALLVPGFTYAQDGLFLSNGSTFGINAGSTIAITGDFENQSPLNEATENDIRIISSDSIILSGNVSLGNGALIQAQEGIQNNSVVNLGASSSFLASGSINNSNSITVAGGSAISAGLDFTNGGLVDIGANSTFASLRDLITNGGTQFSSGDGTQMDIDGNINNNGVFINSGMILLDGDFLNQGTYNGSAGSLTTSGMGQSVNTVDSIGFIDLILNGGDVVFNQTVGVAQTLELNSGLLQFTDPNFSAWITEQAEVLGGNETSYVEGAMVREGTGFRNFPVGKNGTYGLVEFIDVQGVNPIYSLEMFEPLPVDTIDRSLRSISPLRYWQFDSLSGEFMGTVVQIRIVGDEDFANLPALQNANAEFTKLAIAEADIVEGPYNSINDFEPTELDQSEFVISDSLFTKRFLALAVAPTIPPNGVVFIPTAFSPRSLDPEDQVVKVYGEKINPEAGFSFRVFDRNGLVVYETDSFMEANTVGWDGTNSRNGAEVPTGSYPFSIQAQFENGTLIDEIGTITLVR